MLPSASSPVPSRARGGSRPRAARSPRSSCGPRSGRSPSRRAAAASRAVRPSPASSRRRRATGSSARRGAGPPRAPGGGGRRDPAAADGRRARPSARPVRPPRSPRCSVRERRRSDCPISRRPGGPDVLEHLVLGKAAADQLVHPADVTLRVRAPVADEDPGRGRILLRVPGAVYASPLPAVFPRRSGRRMEHVGELRLLGGWADEIRVAEEHDPVPRRPVREPVGAGAHDSA